MTDPISLTLASLQVDLQRLNVIANNAANALTPGFKRELVALGSQATAATGVSADAAIPGMPQVRIHTDHAPGTPRQTSNPLDLALLGEGYFELQTPQGSAYTREGAFRLDAQGRLVSSAGHAVVGTRGDIVLSSANPIIDRAGRIFEQGKQVAQLKVVDFGSKAALRGIGGGLFLPQGAVYPRDLERPRIAQGQLESSNVDSNREMVNLMETYRLNSPAWRGLPRQVRWNDGLGAVICPRQQLKSPPPLIEL